VAERQRFGKNARGEAMIKSNRRFRRVGMAFCMAWVSVIGGVGLVWPGRGAAASPDDPQDTASVLAELLRDGRAVISANQPLINDPAIGPKDLTGDKVLKLAADMFLKDRKRALDSYPADSREGRLLGLLGRAIHDVMDAHQDDINVKGVAFKGFIPAVFGRLVSERFVELAHGDARMKVTAPMELVRNRRSRPDTWEDDVIRTQFQSAGWAKGTPFETQAKEGDHVAFRMLIPEYYSASCLSCHGDPKGEIDRTGYPKEGAKEGDLGGVISIWLDQR
jgi:hypothetical protein